MSRNDDYTTRFFVSSSSKKKKKKALVLIDLSRQKIKNIPQQISFVGKLEEDEF